MSARGWRGRRPRIRARLRLGLIAAACLVSLTSSSIGQALPAAAGTAHPGVGFSFGGGDFMGTYAVDGRPTFCIDLNGQGPSTASGYTASAGRTILKQLGWTKDHKGGNAGAVRGPALSKVELAQLAYLLDRYAGTRSAATAAAAEHLVRALTVGDQAQAAREAVRWKQVGAAHPATRTAFEAIAKDVQAHAGPYAVTATWSTSVSAKSDGVLAVSVVAASGAAMAGVPVRVGSGTGPGAQTWTAVTDGTGAASVAVTAAAKGTLDLIVAAANLPGPAPTLYTPKRYGTARSPDHFAQRTVGASARTAVTTTATVTIEGATPKVTTRAKPAAPTLTDSLTDDITVSGSARGYQGAATASLWGPFATAPSAKSCAGTTGPVATTTVDVSSDGTVTTTGLPVSSPGYYTWTVDLPAGPLQDAVSTPCADKTETVFVTAAPALTIATDGPPAPGVPTTATVSVSGMYPGYAPKATLALYGPFATAPTAADCTSKTKALTTTVSLPGDGDYPTKAFTLPVSGHYTWAVSVPGNATQPAITLDCGADDQTFAAVRPDLTALTLTQTGSVDATPPGSTTAARSAKLTIVNGPIAAPLVSAGPLLGGIDVPANVALAAEFDQGAHAGDLLGTIVIAGRPTDPNNAPGALANLAGVSVGDQVTLVDVSGKTQKFIVDGTTTLPRGQQIPASLLVQDEPLRLLILSTTDPVPYGSGLTSYRSHLLVSAAPA
jgi:hypothetical protein